MNNIIIKTVFLLFYFELHCVFACRYNIRETGFVDLGTEFYYVYFYVDQNTPENFITSFREIVPALLEDTNLTAEIINVAVEGNNEAIKYFDFLPNKSIPKILLVSPDGQSKILPFEFKEHNFKVSLKSQIVDIFSSALIEQIKRDCAKNYAVVLLVESKNEVDNAQAKIAIKMAIKNIQQKMVWLPKEITNPPVLVSLPYVQKAEEQYLLWSLGIHEQQINEPMALVIYGRMRWLGPLFVGEQITSQNVSAILELIGLDCECGLDKRWIQGTMLPAKWDQTVQTWVAKNLGFDPENPIIKMEMSRILSTDSSFPGVPLNLASESEMDDSIEQKIVDSKANQTENSASLNSVTAENKEKLILPNSMLILMGILIIIMVGGVVLFLRAKIKMFSSP